MPTFDRGFKTWAERTALGFRRELNLPETAALTPDGLAQFLNVEVWYPKDVKGLSQDNLNQLLVRDRGGWSAVTIRRGKQYVIIGNPTNSPARSASDVMHELAHIIAGHEPSKMVLSPDGQLAMRTFDQKQEDEANWLSGCLLLPRPALLHIRRLRLPDAQACSTYGVSGDLLSYRFNVTGVNFQFRRLASIRQKVSR